MEFITSGEGPITGEKLWILFREHFRQEYGIPADDTESEGKFTNFVRNKLKEIKELQQNIKKPEEE